MEFDILLLKKYKNPESLPNHTIDNQQRMTKAQLNKNKDIFYFPKPKEPKILKPKKIKYLIPNFLLADNKLAEKSKQKLRDA